MTTRISYNALNGPGLEVADYVDAIELALARGRRLKAKLDSMSAAGDFAAIVTEIGGGLTTQSAQDLWTIISTAQAQFDSPQIAELARLDRR